MSVSLFQWKRSCFSGVYKNPSDIRYVLETYGGKGVYTVESLEHLKNLQRIAGELGLTIDVLIRVTSGNQFGVDEEDIRKIISRRQEYTALHILGLQFYYEYSEEKSFTDGKGASKSGCLF